MPRRRDQHRPTPSRRRTTPGGARPQHTPPKQESDAVRITPAHAHQPPETTQGMEGTSTRGERARPTEKAAGSTAAQPTTTPSPPGDEPGNHKGHLTGTGRGQRHAHSTQGWGQGPPQDTGPRHRPPRGSNRGLHLRDPLARGANPDPYSTDPANHRHLTTHPRHQSATLRPALCTTTQARLTSTDQPRHNTRQHDTPHRSAPQCIAPRQDTPNHNTPQHDATRRGTERHTTARHGATRRTTAHQNTKARDANQRSNQNKPPHSPKGTAPARHTQAKNHRTPGNNGGGPPTQTAARK